MPITCSILESLIPNTTLSYIIQAHSGSPTGFVVDNVVGSVNVSNTINANVTFDFRRYYF